MPHSSTWNMADIVRHGARDHPQRTALIFQARPLTYGELNRRANRVANGLLKFKVARQARVAFLDFNDSRHLEVFFGAAKADCVLVGVNARLAAQEVVYILNDSAATVLFVGREHVAVVEAIESQLTGMRHIVALDGEHSRWPDYHSWCQQHPATDPFIEVRADNDVIQLYTSGTTGNPKGVCHTHHGWKVFSQAMAAAGWASYNQHSVTFVCMPLFHVAGFNLCCLTLLGGGCIVLSRRVDAGEILDFIPRYRITDTLFVPTVIIALVNHPRAASTDFSSLQLVSYGAAPIADDLLQRARQLFNCDFIHLYGLTENLGAATCLPPQMHHSELGKLKSCGKAYADAQIKIVDAGGRELHCGQMGEIVIRCPWTMSGYWRAAAATAAAIRDGWLHTGDAAYMDADGYVYIQDRVKDMIVSGGENIYPAEVENALFGHPAITEVAVIGVPDEKWGEAVKAIIVLKPGATLDAEDILQFARARIAGYKLPKSIATTTALPRNASGKVLRRQLREPYWRGRDRQVS